METVVIRSKDVMQRRYPLSKNLVSAAGMLKGRMIDGLKYQRELRRGWEARFKKLEHMSRSYKRK